MKRAQLSRYKFHSLRKCDNDSFHDLSCREKFSVPRIIYNSFRAFNRMRSRMQISLFRVPQLRSFEFFRVVVHYSHICIYDSRIRLFIRTRSYSSKDIRTYSTEIVIATPYNDSIDIIQDSLAIADFSWQCDIFVAYA